MEQSEILDKLTKTCFCKAVSRATIKKAIVNGADTLEAVWEATNSGDGSCRGKQCAYKIQELLDEMLYNN